MPSSHLILCRPILLLPPIPPSIRVFPMSQLFAWEGQSPGVSALASFLPKNAHDWSPLEWILVVSQQSTFAIHKFARECLCIWKEEIVIHSPSVLQMESSVGKMGCAQSLQSCVTLCDLWTVDCRPSVCPWDSPGKNTGVGCCALLQEIFQIHISGISCIAGIFFTNEPNKMNQLMENKFVKL